MSCSFTREPRDVLAAELLKEARRRSVLSQVELGRRAGVTQSMVSAYESGLEQPALQTLARLVAVTGLHLTVSLEERVGQPLSGPVGKVVQQQRRHIVSVADAHGATHVRVFGSVARGEDAADSDVDLLVDLPPGLGLLGYGRLLDDLESVLGGITVDVVPAASLKPEVRARVEREAIPL